ncbi:MAG: 8-amino-7-oxononanoate synthase [Planctomycetota bacterium]|nr:MAG: 8-amino-7-oxononanoate synthase [Planctomycetota bacterium]
MTIGNELFQQLERELADWSADGLYRPRRVVEPLPGGRCRIEGRELIDFSRNDYLGLSHHPRVVQAARSVLGDPPPSDFARQTVDPTAALAKCLGATASAQVSGRTPAMAELEAAIAEFEGTEDALVFPSGFAANVGTISALAGRDDLLLCDRLNHASLIDGARLSGATLRVYRHDRLDRLERALRNASGYRRRFVVTDTVFSMDGRVAPLRDLCDLADRFEATLIVDEAHATGVFGPHGRGIVEELGLEDRIAVRVGTLSKAVAALGGFVAGSRTLIEYLRQFARPYVYSTALPPCVCAAARAALEVIRTEPQLRQRLRRGSAETASALRSAGVPVADDVRGPIVPILLRDNELACRLGEALFNHGLFVPAIRPPTVPRGTARLRISLSAAHRQQDLQRLRRTLIALLSRETGPEPSDDG